MFTGIVREVGLTAAIAGRSGGIRLEIEAPETAAATALGDSVAIDGCCLTAVAVGGGSIAFDAVPETLARTSLGGLVAGAARQLEPALRAGDPLGGHYVQGHVDGVGVVRSVGRRGRRKARLVRRATPRSSATSSRKGRSPSRERA